MHERLSLTDDSLIAGYAENIQRFEFALEWCRGKRVLDAGCGSGYGAHFLASNGAASVLAVDISSAAVTEAAGTYRRDNLRFATGDLQNLAAHVQGGQFDAIVNFETLPHLAEPEKFMHGVSSALAADGVFICSTPNGELVATGRDGSPLYKYQHKTYTADGLHAFLSARFGQVVLYGHSLTHQGRLRKVRARELFAQLSEAYYNPAARVGRAIRRLAGKKNAGPPVYSGEADSYAGDYVIAPLASARFAWPPTTLLAVCRG